MSDQAFSRHSDPPIVVAVDGSVVSYRAVAWAATDAALHGCPLHLITSQAFELRHGSVPFVSGERVDHLRSEGEQIVAEAVRIACDTPGGDRLRVETEVIFDQIIPCLIARSWRARTLVVGSHGGGAVRRAVLGSVASAMVRHAQCPVAVVHATSATDAVSRQKPVLVGVDASAHNLIAIAMAFEEASLRHVGIIALHAQNNISTADLPTAGWDFDREGAVMAENLAGYRGEYPDVPVRRMLARDQPARALLSESQNAQLVVVGSHGRGRFTGALLGSTSAALVQSVECPIIITREPAADRPVDVVWHRGVSRPP